MPAPIHSLKPPQSPLLLLQLLNPHPFIPQQRPIPLNILHLCVPDLAFTAVHLAHIGFGNHLAKTRMLAMLLVIIVSFAGATLGGDLIEDDG